MPVTFYEQIMHKYIVIFKSYVTKEQMQQYEQNIIDSGGYITQRYESILNGFAAVIPDNLVSSLQLSDLVETIEPDSIATIQ